MLTLFDPQPPPAELPGALANPFATDEPHPLARRAATALQAELARAELRGLDEAGRGKMFGVLVVATGEGRIGWLRGFSGMLEGRWLVDGFAPPLFDVAARDAVWTPGQEELRAFEQQHRGLAGGERRELERVRAARSNEMLDQLIDGYRIVSARGEPTSLRALYAGEPPPGGAGDCAGPKLLALAFARGWQPLALAEFWWGAPPLTGGRTAGMFYPACRRKCGVVLPFMLGIAPPPPEIAELRILHQDESLIVVDKPYGLLAAPDRHDPERDSALVRLRARDAGELAVVDRMDAETSGLLLVARDAASHAALTRQFARGEADKQWIAWLDGVVAGDAGRVELALRLDFAARPRRIHDPRHGKRAVTDWRVLARTAARTQVQLTPRTGRTHQLRVHAALGLGAPIVGDALYGSGGADERLALHAHALAFAHPRTGARMAITSP